MESYVDVRITPISQLVPLSKYNSNISSVNNRDRFSSLNLSGRSGSNRNLLIGRNTRLDKSQYLKPPKSIQSNNNLLLISRKSTSKPKLALMVTPNINQIPNATGKKKVLLYQQIEGNKLFSNNSELANRFNYKV